MATSSRVGIQSTSGGGQVGQSLRNVFGATPTGTSGRPKPFIPPRPSGGGPDYVPPPKPRPGALPYDRPPGPGGITGQPQPGPTLQPLPIGGRPIDTTRQLDIAPPPPPSGGMLQQPDIVPNAPPAPGGKLLDKTPAAPIPGSILQRYGPPGQGTSAGVPGFFNPISWASGGPFGKPTTGQRR